MDASKHIRHWTTNDVSAYRHCELAKQSGVSVFTGLLRADALAMTMRQIAVDITLMIIKKRI